MPTEDAKRMNRFRQLLFAILPLVLIGYGAVVIACREFVPPTRYSSPHVVSGAAAIVYGLGMICFGASYFLWIKWPTADDDDALVISYHRAAMVIGFLLVVASAVMSAKLWR